jgi:uncharacterized LabA/DUF88 family protein/cold shock CspA family protein
MPEIDNQLTRIAVFYDGHFFALVSNYYLYQHERHARISIVGLHSFIRREVARLEGSNARYCQIVDAHYFRGRLNAYDAQERNMLFKERVFDDILVKEGVITHYTAIGPHGEKGIDVWLALEAFELAINKQFNVCVLVAGDGDYVPLARKLNTLGTRVMVLGWDFSFTDEYGQLRETRTSQALLNEVTYPIMMNNIIEDRARKATSEINELFVEARRGDVPEIQPTTDARPGGDVRPSPEVRPAPVMDDTLRQGRIINLCGNYGFIAQEVGGDNLFFQIGDLWNCVADDLVIGMVVCYVLGSNARGVCAKRVQPVRYNAPTASGPQDSPYQNSEEV